MPQVPGSQTNRFLEHIQPFNEHFVHRRKWGTNHFACFREYTMDSRVLCMIGYFLSACLWNKKNNYLLYVACNFFLTMGMRCEIYCSRQNCSTSRCSWLWCGKKEIYSILCICHLFSSQHIVWNMGKPRSSQWVRWFPSKSGTVVLSLLCLES